MSTSTGENRSPSPFIQAMSPEERKEHMSRLGAKANAERLVLSAEEKAHLAEAYKLLDRIYQRHADKLNGGGDAS